MSGPQGTQVKILAKLVPAEARTLERIGAFVRALAERIGVAAMAAPSSHVSRMDDGTEVLSVHLSLVASHVVVHAWPSGALTVDAYAAHGFDPVGVANAAADAFAGVQVLTDISDALDWPVEVTIAP